MNSNTERQDDTTEGAVGGVIASTPSALERATEGAQQGARVEDVPSHPIADIGDVTPKKQAGTSGVQAVEETTAGMLPTAAAAATPAATTAATATPAPATTAATAPGPLAACAAAAAEGARASSPPKASAGSAAARGAEATEQGTGDGAKTGPPSPTNKAGGECQATGRDDSTAPPHQWAAEACKDPCRKRDSQGEVVDERSDMTAGTAAAQQQQRPAAHDKDSDRSEQDMVPQQTLSGDQQAETGAGVRLSKKPRLVWTPELHTRFMNAVNHLGVKNAVPKTILQLMNVEGMTRENVASHLQKYRLYLKRMHGLGPSDRLPEEVNFAPGAAAAAALQLAAATGSMPQDASANVSAGMFSAAGASSVSSGIPMQGAAAAAVSNPAAAAAMWNPAAAAMMWPTPEFWNTAAGGQSANQSAAAATPSVARTDAVDAAGMLQHQQQQYAALMAQQQRQWMASMASMAAGMPGGNPFGNPFGNPAALQQPPPHMPPSLPLTSTLPTSAGHNQQQHHLPPPAPPPPPPPS